MSRSAGGLVAAFVKTDRFIGLVLLALALVCLFLWIPLDSETGLVEKIRRRLVIGDALAPTMAACLIGISCLSLIWRGRRENAQLNVASVTTMVFYVIFFCLCLLIMRFAGPALIFCADIIFDAELNYRNLRGHIPIKYIGFLMGGTVFIFGLGAFIDRVYSRARWVIAFAITLIMALLFDLPFEDILLPPNGDV